MDTPCVLRLSRHLLIVCAHHNDRISRGCVLGQVDVFSFGVVLWEIWNLGALPYSHLTMNQIFNGVMNDSLRPHVPEDCHPGLTHLMTACWASQ